MPGEYDISNVEVTVVEILNSDEEHALEAMLMAEERGGVAEGENGAACAHPESVPTEALEGLERLGFVSSADGVLFLTTSGRKVAEDLVRRHRLTEVLLDTVLGLDRQRGFDIGCQMEHQMPPEMSEAFCTLLGHPEICPHGWPIPAGPCCQAGKTAVTSQVVPLTALKPGEKGRLFMIKPKTHDRLHRLSSLGLRPGVIVELHASRPSLCFRFEGTELAVEKDVAEDIFVTRLKANY